MYRFQISAYTQMGETIALVGSTPELGLWDISKAIPLATSADRYPLWETTSAIAVQPLTSAQSQFGDPFSYQYVRLREDGTAHWESLGANRSLTIQPEYRSQVIVVDDGDFGRIQPYPCGYLEHAPAPVPVAKKTGRLKIVVLGSSVALGCKAWLLQGWEWLLRQALQPYGHEVVNVSEVGANVKRTIARFPDVVVPHQPDIVIIALSLGNEGLASCPPHERRAVQRRFESGLQQLIKLTRDLGAQPILGGVYPNDSYTSDHHWLIKDTQTRMRQWDAPVLDWLAVVDDGHGHWKARIGFDPAHPNTLGHRLMFQAIDLNLFTITKAQIAAENQRLQKSQTVLYQDETGFSISVSQSKKELQIGNSSPYSYTIAPYWQDLQSALQQSNLTPGIYVAQPTETKASPFLAIRADGAIDTTLDISPGAHLTYRLACDPYASHRSQLLFYDGHLGIVQETDQHLLLINESHQDYNIHPMWREVRSALKAMPSGVYTDPLNPDAPFRTLMIGKNGLESRVKAPPRSAIRLAYQCKLSDIHRVAILPLGDRCAVRMMLYKMEYDGPAFPFDLTRTTKIGDIADMIESRFHEMWNPALLDYSAAAGRIYHRKWTGLSFAHEIEETDNPLADMSPVYKRMRDRYSARSQRFWYTLNHCDKALFVRTGVCDRGGVIDLVHKLEHHCHGKPFHLLILSPQCSDEFANLPNVLHYDFEFNPDRMYDDLGHWLYCTEVMRGILDSLGISSKNLFWCPPKVDYSVGQNA
jgi:lysophospholipase L1-like esterase